MSARHGVGPNYFVVLTSEIHCFGPQRQDYAVPADAEVVAEAEPVVRVGSHSGTYGVLIVEPSLTHSNDGVAQPEPGGAQGYACIAAVARNVANLVTVVGRLRVTYVHSL